MGATAEHDVEQLRARLNDYMAKHGLRSTEQRRLVTEMFFATGEHLSIEDLLDRVRIEEPKIGYATVYRTLKLLKECGLAFERHFGDGVSRYEVAWQDEHHDHLICIECEKIIEFEDDAIEELQHNVASGLGFKLVRHKLELYGVCADCQAKAQD
ncbi:MAG: transcriptional repressor [Myxococcales bacterium]|jgi:Fur family ferric uptake transcriptional regulator|nr:transcriptional repressor [Deltaproteobacteria bacterium]NOQ84317.1 transcriptional repressor [Myxococcales bacterium]